MRSISGMQPRQSQLGMRSGAIHIGVRCGLPSSLIPLPMEWTLLENVSLTLTTAYLANIRRVERD